jgi:hypothetical protein
VGHFGAPTPKVQALETSMSPIVIVGWRLAHDETFRRHAVEVAGAPDPAACADSFAAGYVRAGPGRRAVELMLLEASRCATVQAMANRLMNMSRTRAVRSDAPLDETDPKYRSAPALAHYERGAEIVARRGARRCLRAECGALKVTGYCSSHPAKRFEMTDDQTAVRVTVRAVAEELGLSTDGPRVRRVRRGAGHIAEQQL